MIVRVRAQLEGERDPSLLALVEAANSHQVNVLTDDGEVTIGSGVGSMTWTRGQVPAASGMDWSSIADVPIALVTGSNGKTTTVRLLSAMITAAGYFTGHTSTDGVVAGRDVLAAGDYAGPEGARLVLRDRRVEAAVLETARGGMLRRGLAVMRAQVAVITNVAPDHLGEFGMNDLPALADAKLTVAKAIGPFGHVILNADDPLLLERGRRLGVPVAWFSLDAQSPQLAAALERGGRIAVLEEDGIVLRRGAARIPVAAIDDLPIAMGGAARHNVANALAATLAAWCLGCPVEAIRRALVHFGRDNADNPGRANLFDWKGAHILVDYAHNPHGMDALSRVAQAIPSRRRLVLLGQAGNRDDDSVRGLARSAWSMRPDRVVLKELDAYRRGRGPGEIPRLMAEELAALGAPDDAVSIAPDELAAVRDALAWARAGDLLVLTVHSDREAVLELLREMGATAVGGAGALPFQAATDYSSSQAT